MTGDQDYTGKRHLTDPLCLAPEGAKQTRSSGPAEELLAELAAMRRLVNQLVHKIERLRSRLREEARVDAPRSIMQEDGTAAELYPPQRRSPLWRGRDDEDSDGSD